MNIVYTSDDNFVPQTCTGMVSVMENNKDSSIHFYILSKNIKPNHKQMITALASHYGQQVDLIDLPSTEELCGKSIDTGGWNNIVLSRLFLNTLLPKDVDKVLYMDGDTIVRKGLIDLYNTDISNYTLAAVIEPTVPGYRKEELGLSKDANYYNAGVLLINLKLWRERNTSQRILQYFEAHGGKLFANDQDAINGCLADEILPVSISYNFCNTYDFYPYRAVRKWMGPKNSLSKQEYKDICADPTIVHFLGEERPWRYGNRHRFSRDFFKYYKKTPIGWDLKTRYDIIEHGWERYFFCFYFFNMITKPFPEIRLKIISTLIPVFMKIRKKKLKKK